MLRLMRGSRPGLWRRAFQSAPPPATAPPAAGANPAENAVAAALPAPLGEHPCDSCCTPAALTVPSPTVAVSLPEDEDNVESGDPLETAVLDTLQRSFGHTGFRGMQWAAISALLSGQDTAVFWATGSGKSLCYQLPPLHTGLTAFVVSPLISLMQDQVMKLNRSCGKRVACFLGSTQTDLEVVHDALSGNLRVVYLTPEYYVRVARSAIQDLARDGKVCLFAVDEAHCVSEWGHDFRPEYMQIGALRPKGVPMLALTATALPKCREDILRQLHMSNPVQLVSTFDRPNFNISCAEKESTPSARLDGVASMILEEIGNGPGSVLVYTKQKKDATGHADGLSKRLESHGIIVRSYHAGMTDHDRDEVFHGFMSGKVQVVVATVAFGMGIDKSDIRMVVHIDPPRTIEEYVQQIGRAGRDGKSTRCHLIASDKDFWNTAAQAFSGNLPESVKGVLIQSTHALRRYFSDTSRCRRRMILEFFRETPSFERCGTCDNCRAMQRAAQKPRAPLSVNDIALPLLQGIIAITSEGRKDCTPFVLVKALTAPKIKGKLDPRSRSLLRKARSGFRKLGDQMTTTRVVASVLAALSDADTPILRRRIYLAASVRAHCFFSVTPHGIECVEEGTPIEYPLPHVLREARDATAVTKVIWDDHKGREASSMVAVRKGKAKKQKKTKPKRQVKKKKPGAVSKKITTKRVIKKERPKEKEPPLFASLMPALPPSADTGTQQLRAQFRLKLHRIGGKRAVAHLNLLNDLSEWRTREARERKATPDEVLPERVMIKASISIPRYSDHLADLFEADGGAGKEDSRAIVQLVDKHFPRRGDEQTPLNRLGALNRVLRRDRLESHEKPPPFRPPPGPPLPPPRCNEDRPRGRGYTGGAPRGRRYQNESNAKESRQSKDGAQWEWASVGEDERKRFRGRGYTRKGDPGPSLMPPPCRPPDRWTGEGPESTGILPPPPPPWEPPPPASWGSAEDF
eukprot:Hpha_TRINITY_DN16038_c6_g6::TRINITY_DN16038_c6_g6_i1::g.117452::m.117452